MEHDGTNERLFSDRFGGQTYSGGMSITVVDVIGPLPCCHNFSSEEREYYYCTVFIRKKEKALKKRETRTPSSPTRLLIVVREYGIGRKMAAFVVGRVFLLFFSLPLLSLSRTVQKSRRRHLHADGLDSTRLFFFFFFTFVASSLTSRARRPSTIELESTSECQVPGKSWNSVDDNPLGLFL